MSQQHQNPQRERCARAELGVVIYEAVAQVAHGEGGRRERTTHQCISCESVVKINGKSCVKLLCVIPQRNRAQALLTGPLEL